MISPLVLDAAEQIARRAIYHAEQLFIDPAGLPPKFVRHIA
jgi:hypothetical protein